MTRLPLPDHYKPAHAREAAYSPEPGKLLAAALAWRARHGLAPAAQDARRIVLLLIDVQRDFCFPQGSLYVGGRTGDGAMADSDRIARFIYAQLPQLSEVICTLDTHLPHQIFFPAFWRDPEGRPPAPHREVTSQQVLDGELTPAPELAAWLCAGDQDWLRRQAAFYCAELERAGKYRLYLWPEHCLLGGEGHLLAGVLQEARLFHAFARGAANSLESKGQHPLTENYSVLAPEVLACHDGGALSTRNTAFVERLLQADKLIIAGQAASHCVKSSIEDLLSEIQAHDPGRTRDVYILRDGMSSVVVPDAEKPGGFLFDFTPEADAALARFEAAGMHLVETSTPIEQWPAWTS